MRKFIIKVATFIKVAIAVAAIAAVLVLAGGWAIGKASGAFRYQPEALQSGLSRAARELVEQSFADVPPGALRDHHVHLVGVGAGDTGAWVNPKGFSWAHPRHRIGMLAYMSGAAVSDLGMADQQFADRLVRLARNIPQHGKFQLLAFDHYYDHDGSRNLEKSEFYTPNEYVFDIAQRYPELFIPAISVHPHRADALQELEHWARQGVRFVKWLPNAQGIRASEARHDEYYRMLVANDMVLLTHVGEEQAVEAEEDQALGNPLHFRRPLEMGVKVVMAHCGSLGDDEDLDQPGRRESSFRLFMRLMDDPRYEGLLFGDISAMTQFNRLPGPLLEIMRREDLHHRLVDGSDYPLPALNIVIRTLDLQNYGMISAAERSLLNEIYHYNPLLFDYVLKRTIRVPDTGERLSAAIFTANPAL